MNKPQRSALKTFLRDMLKLTEMADPTRRADLNLHRHPKLGRFRPGADLHRTLFEQSSLPTLTGRLVEGQNRRIAGDPFHFVGHVPLEIRVGKLEEICYRAKLSRRSDRQVRRLRRGQVYEIYRGANRLIDFHRNRVL